MDKPIDEAALTTVRFLDGGVVQMDRADYDRLTAAQQQGQVVAYIEHSADKSSAVHLTQAGMQLGIGRHACYTAAPPSAPVGVGDAVRAFWQGYNAQTLVGGGRLQGRTAAGVAAVLALAQQPSVPTLAKHQPCGCVICTCEDEQQCRGCGAKHCGNRTGHPPYVAQQPAAVDEARSGSSIMDGAVSFVEALAAQHQEPKSCKHCFVRDEDHGGACCQLCGEVKL